MKKKEEGPDYYAFVGATLAGQRKRLGWSQEIAAERLKIGASDLSRLENGRKPIAEDLLFKICRIYGIPVGEVASEAYGRYRTYLLQKASREDEPVEQLLPTHPFAVQVLESYDLYVKSQRDQERDVFLRLLRYLEILTTAS